ncbi:hypothetical protein [[Clostridium] fimetarium]|uniref:ABC-2 family transporter protein n=1 Tax=[Clostridium] fimetarium TaxID=99656 RepID=A0A1I0RPM8_9FIRM|nr:hypothetical protein [[Clostridium] fimetarium]SEW43045.1 hypothetical protein SAMN05421659_12020 [[Clostridium] fimetarium]
MKEMIKIERERVQSNWGFWLSLSIGCTIAIAQIIMEVGRRSQDIIGGYRNDASCYLPSVFNSWIGGSGFSPYSFSYRTIFPILAILPCAITYFMDMKTGYVKNIFSRTFRRNYYISKYLVNFIAGGISVVIPMLLNLLITACLLPSLLPSTNNLFAPISGSMLVALFYSHPYYYILIYMLIYFIYGGVFATLALSLVGFVHNIFMFTLCPFLMYYCLGIIASYIYNIHIGSWSPIYILDLTQPYKVKLSAIIIEAVLIGTISSAIYIWRGFKDDIY